jgi:hypothetical protein
MTIKLILKTLILIFLFSFTFAGEPGTSDVKEKTYIENSEEKKSEIKEEEKKVMVPIDTKVTFPINPLRSLFKQNFAEPINSQVANILNVCQPINKNHSCIVVEPKNASSHFNNYHYFINDHKNVNAIIAYLDKRVGNRDYCRSLINEWQSYFKNFSLKDVSNQQDPDILSLQSINDDSTDIQLSCYPEKFADTESFFSLKVVIDEK